MLTTTFNLLRNAGACESGYRKLAKNLGGIAAYGKDTPIPILAILESNGLDDALWSLRAVPEEQAKDRDRIARLFACDCAERVMTVWSRYYPKDTRPQMSIEVARRYANGQATDEELTAAREAAREAAGSTAGTAAGSTAGTAARDAAWSAARAAARDADLDTARDAAGAAAWAAAGDASWDAAGDAVWDAAWIAAGADARDAEKKAQADLLRQYLTPVVEPVTT